MAEPSISGVALIVSFLVFTGWVFCLVDALRRQRDYFWLMVLIFLPGLGVLLYCLNFFVLEGAGWRRLDVAFRDKRRAAILEREIAAADIPGKREELAWIYLQGKLWGNCLQAAGPALDRDPENLRLQYCAGAALFHLGRHLQALPHFQYIREAEPYYEYGEALLLLAQTCEMLNRKNEAVLTLELLLEKFSHPEGMVRYARLLLERGYRDEAARQLDQLLRESAAAPQFHARKHRRWLREASTLARSIHAKH